MDNAVDAAYIRLKSSEIVDSETVSDDIIFDYDKDDRVIGVEVLRFSRQQLDNLLKTIPFESESQKSELINLWNFKRAIA
ncbi:DUF2283 domain-containing protein [Oscillatoria salina IIICB1]|nr:DUF2283 domain-containing protein [Oscillatoria salina IIICB1]